MTQETGNGRRQGGGIRLLIALTWLVGLAGLHPAAAVASPSTATGLAIAFGATGPCTVGSASLGNDGVTSAPVTVSGAGTCAITATQPGGGTYAPASSVVRSFVIARATPSIALTPLASTTHDDPITLKATVSPHSLTGTVSFAIDGTAVGSVPVGTGGVATSSPITVTQTAGPHSVTASFLNADRSGGDATTSSPFTVSKEDVTLTYLGESSGEYQDPVTLKAQLLEDGSKTTPLAGATVSFVLGKQSCSPVTGSDGIASCQITPSADNVPTPSSVSVSYASDSSFLGASLTPRFTLRPEETPPAYGAFVVGDLTAADALKKGTTVTWWGSRWSKLNRLSGGPAPATFRGFAATLTPSSLTCPGSWTTPSSATPPATVPSYMAVIVSHAITRSNSKDPKNAITGDIQQLVIVKTATGYTRDPGHAGSGTVVATLCPTSSAPHLSPSHAAGESRSRTRGNRSQHGSHAHVVGMHPHLVFHLTPPRPIQGQGRDLPVTQLGGGIAGYRTPISRLRAQRLHAHGLQTHTTSQTAQYILFDRLADRTVDDSPFSISASSVTQIPVDPNLPPDPQTIAPAPADAAAPTSLASSTAFLYTGQNPIQTGMTAVIVPQRAAVLRGRVLDVDGNPLTGATVSILNHPEYGQTLSRQDGGYDLAINGGGQLTVAVSASGYLPGQRQVTPTWDNFTRVDDLALVRIDPNSTRIDLSSSATYQVVRGTIVSDSRGTRQEILAIPAGETARFVLADGTTQPAPSVLHLHISEYTVGSNGPTSMPSELPATSAYTYCVNYTADEAPAGASLVFSKPVVALSNDFLGTPAGTVVPDGSYDQGSGQWQANHNGLTIAILGVDASTGEAQLDVDGSGNPATASQLAALGITDDERRLLAQLYASGAIGSAHPHSRPHERPLPSFLRSPSQTIKPNDENFNKGQNPPGPSRSNTTPNQSSGSSQGGGGTFDLQNQLFGEDLSLAGTPFHLHYNSDRSPGNLQTRTFAQSISGPTVPAGLTEIDVDLQIAGRVFSAIFPAQPNQSFTFTWDGMDGYGRPVQGPAQATMRVSYIYPLSYATVAASNPFGFGAFASVPVAVGHTSNDPHTNMVSVDQFLTRTLGSFDPRPVGMGGWTLDIHHSYDASTKTLFMGDGTTRRAEDRNNIISTVAGNGVFCWRDCGNNGGKATASGFSYPKGLAIAADGTMYVLNNDYLRKIDSAGIITNVVSTGGGVCASASAGCGEGIPASDATLSDSHGVVLGPDGSIYLADRGTGKIRRIGLDGIIRTVAGGGSDATSNNIAATQAAIDPVALAVTPDGSIFVASGRDFSSGVGTIRRISTAGIISTVAGDGSGNDPQDGAAGLETGVRYLDAAGMAAAPDSSLYFWDSNYLVHLDTNGIIHVVYGGSGVPCPTTISKICEGVPAKGQSAGNPGPASITVGPDGSIYFHMFDYGIGTLVRKITPDGIVRTVAGTYTGGSGSPGFNGDGRPAQQATIGVHGGNNAVAVGPDNSLYILDGDQERIRRVGTVFPGIGSDDSLIPSSDGSQLYRFDRTGRHLDTRNSRTGAILYTFGYDAAGRLISVTDADHNITQINHDGSGNLTDITAPFTQKSSFTLTPDGYIAGMTDPLGLTTQLGYLPGGLLTTVTGGRGDNTFTTRYDDQGRLIEADAPDGGKTTISGVDTITGGTVSRTVTVTDPMGHNSNYTRQELPDGSVRNQTVGTDGLTTTSVTAPDDRVTTTTPDGTVSSSLPGPDPRFGMQVPILQQATVKTPAGLTTTTTGTRQVTLSDPSNVLSLTAQTDTVTRNGKTTTTGYDASTRTFTATSPEGRSSTVTTDPLGRPLTVQPPGLAPLTTSYDSHGRPATVTEGTGGTARTTTYSYGTDGYLQSVTDPLHQVTSYTHDADGEVLTSTLPGSRSIASSYDKDGNPTSLTLPGNQVHTFSSTNLDLPSSYNPPALGSTSTPTGDSYNLARQLTKVSLPDGRSITTGYDSAGRPSSTTVAAGSIIPSYDGTTGLLSSVSAPGNVGMSYKYDGTLPTSDSWSGALTDSVTRTFNNDLQLATESINGGNSASFSYNQDQLLTAAGDLTLTRDATSGLVTGTSVGTTSSSPPPITTSSGYTTFGELSSHTASAGSTSLFSQSYTRDALGRVREQTEIVGGVSHTYDYTYDSSERLQQVKVDGVAQLSYTYDANGNRTTATSGTTTTTASYDAQDRLSSQGSTTYSYTLNGDLSSKTDGMGKTTYSYDELGNLRQVTKPDGTSISYLIDGQGRRIGKQVAGTLVQGFLYDGSRLIAETDGAGTVISRFTYGADGATPSLMIKGGTTYRIISDQLGSPRLVVDPSGTVVQRLDYDPYGQVTSDSNRGFQPFGFTGGLYDRDTGFVRLGARDYDPATARWTDKDPSRFSGGLNLYGYVANDPINLVDPSGLGPQQGATCSAGGGAGGSSGILDTISQQLKDPFRTKAAPAIRAQAIAAISDRNRPAGEVGAAIEQNNQARVEAIHTGAELGYGAAKLETSIPSTVCPVSTDVINWVAQFGANQFIGAAQSRVETYDRDKRLADEDRRRAHR